MENISEIASKIFATQCFFLLFTGNANRKQNNLQNALSRSSPTMCTLVEELSNCYDHF